MLTQEIRGSLKLYMIYLLKLQRIYDYLKKKGVLAQKLNPNKINEIVL